MFKILKRVSKRSIIYFILFITVIVLLLCFNDTFFHKVTSHHTNHAEKYLLEIIPSYDNEKGIRSLKFSDEKVVRDSITNFDANLEHMLSAQYQLNFGVSDKKGNRYFIYAVNDNYASFIGKCILGLGNSCGLGKNDSILTLEIPIVHRKQGGYVTSSSVDYKMNYAAGLFAESPFYKRASDKESSDHVIYTSTDTFKKIIENAYQIKWNDFVKKYDSNNPFGINVLEKIFVCIKEKSKVKPIIRLLENIGYNVNSKVMVESKNL